MGTATKRRAKQALVWVVVAGVIGCSTDNGSSAQMPTDSLPVSQETVAVRLQAALTSWAQVSGHKGVSATVIFPNGDEWTGTEGVESATSQLRSEHLIWIASITKTLTGAVILQLAEEGVLGLEDPISRWLEPIGNVDPQITIRQLLNHTNGLANYTASAELSTVIAADNTHRFTPTELLSFLGPRSFERGQRTQYTNTAFLLLGMIAETVSGEAITDLYQERLLGPLGLEGIFLPGVQEPPGPVAAAWNGRGETNAANPLDQMSLITIGQSAFGLFATSQTVARWGKALFTASVLTAAMRAEMTEFVPAAGNIPGESGAGLGIRGYDYLGGQQWGHSGGSPLGSSLMIFDPASGIIVAVLINQGAGADHFTLAPRLLELAIAG